MRKAPGAPARVYDGHSWRELGAGGGAGLDAGTPERTVKPPRIYRRAILLTVESRPGAGSTGTTSTVVFLLLLLIASSAGTLVLAGPSTAMPIPGAAQVSATGGFPSPALPPAAPGDFLASVMNTLVLFNQTVAPGYELSNSTTYPIDAAYDPDNGTVWVGGGDVGTTGIDVVNATTDIGVRILPIGEPIFLGYDNESNTIWATGGVGANTVTVYDASTYAVEAVIPVGIYPEAVLYDNWTNSVFVANFGSANITEIDASTFDVTGNIKVGEGPVDLALDPADGVVYVDAETSFNITGFNPSPTLQYVANIALTGEGSPGPMIADSLNGELYVSGLSPGVQIWSLTTSAMTGTIALPAGGDYAEDGLALDPTNDSLFVAGYFQNAVEEYAPAPTASVPDTGASASITLADNAGPNGLVYDPQLQDVIVVNQGYSSAASTNVTDISVVNNAIVHWGPLADLPYGIAFGGPDDQAYVYDGQSGDLSILNAATEQVEHQVFVGFSVIQHQWIGGSVAYDSANGTVYVDFTPYAVADADVAIVNVTTYAVTYLPTTDFDLPAGLAYDPADQKVFVANYGEGTVTILDASDGAVETALTVGNNPFGVLYDPDNGTVFVSNFGSDNVSVIDAAENTLVKTPTPIDINNEPAGLAYDPANGEVYVAESDADYVANFSATTYAVHGPIYISSTSHPQFLAYDPVNETLLLTEPWTIAGVPGGELGFVNVTNGTYYGHLVLGDDLGPLAWDSATNLLFVSATYPGAVYQISTGAGPPPPSLSATLRAVPSTVVVDATTDLETTVLGATSSLTYSYTGLPPGCTSADTATLPCTPTEAGEYPITVEVSQSGGGSTSAMTTLTVQPPVGPLGVTVQADPSVIGLGASTTITATVSGGVAPYTYVYSGLPTGCTSANASTLACTPTEAGGFDIEVGVTDSAASEVSNSTTLTVEEPLSASLVAAPSTILLGAESTLTVTVSGGVGPFTFAYAGLPTGCTSANASTLACTPADSGDFTIGVSVTDSADQEATNSTTLVVEAKLAATLMATPSSITLGAGSTLVVNVTGGYTGSLTYRYSDLPPGCASADAASLSCVPTASGNYTPQVEVNDSSGHFANASAHLSVTSPPSGTHSSSTTIPWTWIAIGVGVIVLIILVLVLLAARRRREPPERPEPSGPSGGSRPPSAGPPPT